MDIITSGSNQITADTIRLDNPGINDFIGTNAVLANRGYYRAMWTALLERAHQLDLEFGRVPTGQPTQYDHFLDYDHIAALISALSLAQDKHLFGKVLEDGNPTAYRYLVELLSAAALEGYVFRPVTPEDQNLAQDSLD